VTRVRLEFTVEPFHEGVQGPHVVAALDSLRAAGFDPHVAPFGTAIEGDAPEVLQAVSTAAAKAFAAGATGLAISARLIRPMGESGTEFLEAIQKVATALGGSVVGADALASGDMPISWQGDIVGGLRSGAGDTDLREALSKLVAQVEHELGGRLADLPRTGKQQAVRLLSERGAFAFRNSVDKVADAMGVSRVTLYNYLNATRADAATLIDHKPS